MQSTLALDAGRLLMSNLRTVRVVAVLLVALLAVQYLLGMLTNFYVRLDDVHISGGSLAEVIDTALAYASTAGGTLGAHWFNASMSLVLSVGLLTVGVVRKRRWLWVHALIIVVMIMAGAFGGAAFFGYHNDAFSLLMALAFLVAFAVAGSLCFRAFQPRTSSR